MAGSSVYGKGFHDGRQSLITEIRAGLDVSKARNQAASRDRLASAIGTGLAQIIPVVYRVVRDRQRTKTSTATNAE